MEKVIENLEITWLMTLLLDWLLEAERTRMRVQINYWLIDDLRFHKLRCFSYGLLIVDWVFWNTRIWGTCWIGAHCTKIRHDWFFVMWSTMLCFTLTLWRFVNLLLYFTHPLINQSLNMFRIILLWSYWRFRILRSLDSGRRPRILRILNTTCVIFGLLGLRVNFKFFLFLIVVIADYDVLIDVSTLPGE
jgi:hypothetical protein